MHYCLHYCKLRTSTYFMLTTTCTGWLAAAMAFAINVAYTLHYSLLPTLPTAPYTTHCSLHYSLLPIPLPTLLPIPLPTLLPIPLPTLLPALLTAPYTPPYTLQCSLYRSLYSSLYCSLHCSPSLHLQPGKMLFVCGGVCPPQLFAQLSDLLAVVASQGRVLHTAHTRYDDAQSQSSPNPTQPIPAQPPRHITPLKPQLKYNPQTADSEMQQTLVVIF